MKTALTARFYNSVLYELDQVLNHHKTCKGTHKGTRVFSGPIQHPSLLSAHNVVNGECSVNIVHFLFDMALSHTSTSLKIVFVGKFA